MGGGGRRFWLAMGIGAGGGYAKGSPEVNPNYLDGTVAQAAATSAAWPRAKLLHFVPEIGYFVSPKLLLSVQGRLQYTTGATEVHHPSCGRHGVCKPATGAVAVLGKATWFLGDRATSCSPYVSLLAGGGYIRYLVDLSQQLGSTCGPDGRTTCTDTVAGGGLLAGPAAGILYGADARPVPQRRRERAAGPPQDRVQLRPEPRPRLPALVASRPGLRSSRAPTAARAGRRRGRRGGS